MEVSLDIQDDVALIKMDDGKKNAITLSAVDGLNEAQDWLDCSAGRQKNSPSLRLE